MNHLFVHHPNVTDSKRGMTQFLFFKQLKIVIEIFDSQIDFGFNVFLLLNKNNKIKPNECIKLAHGSI